MSVEPDSQASPRRTAPGRRAPRIIFGETEYPFRKGVAQFKDGLREQFPDAADGRAIDQYVDAVFAASKAARNYYAEKAMSGVSGWIAGPFMRRAYLAHTRKTTDEVLRGFTSNQKLIGVLTGQYGDYGLPQGVFGRVDSMKKVKGVKLYPDELLMYVAGVDGLDHENVELRLTRPEGTTDHVALTVAGDPDTVDREAFASEVRSMLNISVDELTIDPDFEAESEDVVVDDR